MVHLIAELAAREAASREAAGLQNEFGGPPPSVIVPPRQSSADARLQMMQQEEDDEGAHTHTHTHTCVLNTCNYRLAGYRYTCITFFILFVDEYITKKQLAAVRFHRNHRLMLEIFSDSKIPDTRSVVTNSRLVVLRKQVNSLLLHQVGLL